MQVTPALAIPGLELFIAEEPHARSSLLISIMRATTFSWCLSAWWGYGWKELMLYPFRHPSDFCSGSEGWWQLENLAAGWTEEVHLPVHLLYGNGRKIRQHNRAGPCVPLFSDGCWGAVALPRGHLKPWISA